MVSMTNTPTCSSTNYKTSPEDTTPHVTHIMANNSREVGIVREITRLKKCETQGNPVPFETSSLACPTLLN